MLPVQCCVVLTSVKYSGIPGADISSTFKVKAHFLPADISKKAEIEEMMRRVGELGGADIVVHSRLCCTPLFSSVVADDNSCRLCIRQVNNAGVA